MYSTHFCTTLLLVLHSYASYIKALMYILSFEKYNIVAFGISNNKDMFFFALVVAHSKNWIELLLA